MKYMFPVCVIIYSNNNDRQFSLYVTSMAGNRSFDADGGKCSTEQSLRNPLEGFPLNILYNFSSFVKQSDASEIFIHFLRLPVAVPT